MSAREWRLVVAALIGAIFDAVFFWKFQPYSTREHGHALMPAYSLPILAFLAGLLLTLAADGKKRWIPIAIIGGFWAANAGLIVADCATDPTNHNLWPFEFVIITIAASPAFLGAGVSTLIERTRRRRGAN